MMNKKIFVVVIVGLLLTIGLLSTDVPNLIDYQGRLTDDNGDPIDGNVSILFSIYDVDTGGTALWSETQNVDVGKGLFQVTLGSNTSLPEDLFDDSDRWIGINVTGDGEMSPRTKIVSVPFAKTDGDWTIDGDDVYHENGDVGIGTNNPTNKLHIEGSGYDPLLYVNKTGSGRGMKVRTTSACAIWVENAGNHGLRVTQANGDGVHITNANGDGIEVASAGGFAGRFNGDGYFSGNLGIGTTTPSDQLTIEGSSYPWMTIESTSIEGGGLSLVSSEEEWQIYNDDTYLTFWQGDDDTGEERMVLDDEGNVGIGFTSPSYKLDVNGNYGWHAPHNFQMRGDGEFSFDFQDGDGNDYWHIWDSVHNSILAVRNNGKVGIGTSSPARTLHVNDYMRLEPVSDPPNIPDEGDIYYDSDDHKLKCFDGSDWQDCW